MPTYDFYHPVSGDRRTLEVPYSVFRGMARGLDTEGREVYEIDGETWCREFAPSSESQRRVSAQWPLESAAAGVLPSQIAEERAHLRKCGVNVEFTKSGKAIFTSHEHRRKALKAMGLLDKLSYV